MQTSLPLHGPVRTYLATCAHCPKGKMGCCPWANYFNEHASVPSIISTHYTRAVANHAAAGMPCDQQITFEELLYNQDRLFETGPKPANCRELNDLFLHLGKILYERLPRVALPLKAVFKDAIPAAIYSLVSNLDLFYLNHHYDILEIINDHFPDYNRLEVFSDYTLKYVIRASFTSCQVTLMDVDLDQELVIDDAVDDNAVTTTRTHISHFDEINFIKARVSQIKADPTCDFLIKTGSDKWVFNASPKAYAYMGMLLYKAMGKKDVAWSTLDSIVHLEGFTLGYVKKLASKMKNGKEPFPTGCIAIKDAFPEPGCDSLKGKPSSEK